MYLFSVPVFEKEVKSGRGRFVNDERSVSKVELTRSRNHTFESGSDAVFKCSLGTFLCFRST